MQDPAREITAVVDLLAAAPTPDDQKSAFQRFVTTDASFRHPLCKVDTGVNSRDNILAIYQWYRVMSSKIDIKVNNIVYDGDQDLLILDITQTFHICFPFNLITPVPSRLLTRIHLRRENDLRYISSQEVFYHPDDFTSLLLPPLVPLVRFVMDSASTISAVNAKVAAGVLGVWRTTSPATRRFRLGPSTPEFRRDKGAVKLRRANNFVSLLVDIRNHLLHSKSTRSVYISMAEKFFLALPQDVRDTCAKPTDHDFHEYVFSNWPMFSSFNAQMSASSLTWGWVEKGEGAPNVIDILSSIVVSAESAAAIPRVPNRLPVELYKLIITVIVLHELSHAFTKFWFNEIVTPTGVGSGKDPRYGESGWLVEEEIMGGRLSVEWEDLLNFGNMDAINRVVLSNGLCSWEIDVNVAETVLSSLKGATFDRPAQDKMKQHFPLSGSVRARLTESTVNPGPMKPAPIGYVFNDPGPVCSFVGDDREPESPA